jgi:hypothetical protein
VIYHVAYSDVTTVGKIVRKRHRDYAYKSDHDFVRKDWQRAVETMAQNYPVKYNRSIIRGKKRMTKKFMLSLNLFIP